MLSKIDKKNDNLWSKVIKKRANNTCEFIGCSVNSRLNSHHVFTRSNRSTRWCLDNGICLCPKHHIFDPHVSAHRAPDFIKILLGEVCGISPIRNKKWYLELRKKASQVVKFTKKDKEEIHKKLKEIYDS